MKFKPGCRQRQGGDQDKRAACPGLGGSSNDGAELGGGQEHHREAGREVARLAPAPAGRVAAVAMWKLKIVLQQQGIVEQPDINPGQSI